MPLPRNNSSETRGLDGPAILKTLLIQVLVLLALSVAVVRYIDWSSDAAWAEFSAARQSTPPAAKLQPQSATSVRAAPCLQRA